MPAAAALFKGAALLFLVYAAATISAGGVAAATWCVVRSDASEQAMQTGLDYACAAGADCAPIQSSGLCYLPNTVQAHASYAYNSYYQRKGDDPASCSFSATANIATTDPSYGSCVYPSSPRTAGGIVAPGGTATPLTTPTTVTEPPPPPPGTTIVTPLYGGGGGNPGMGPTVPNSNASQASKETIFHGLTILLILSFIFRTM